MKIKTDKGNIEVVNLYRYFPLNTDKSYIHSTPRVNKGDTVKPGDLLFDTNFTKDGTLAFGTHLRAAFIPWKGLNFEDGIVITESGAKKLTSEHLYCITMNTKGKVTAKSKYYYYTKTDAKSLEHLDDER
ncbi:MAG: hypothetical protein IE878_07740, partial [Epsilonproteobacteria bacterium]|nr:hypothetical protein [Campylobacterota bacterium]